MNDLWKITATWKDQPDGHVYTKFYGHVVIKDLPNWRLMHRIAGNYAIIMREDQMIHLHVRTEL